jgi:hypothetical protein
MKIMLKNFIVICFMVSIPELITVIGTDCIGSCKSNYHAITVATKYAQLEYSMNYTMHIKLLVFN